MCLKIYELDPTKFVAAPGLVQQVALKRTGVELELSADIDMLLMMEREIRVAISHVVDHYAKANNKYMKEYHKSKESLYLKYWDVNNLYGWALSQKLPVNNFEQTREISHFNEGFIKNYNGEIDERYFLEVDVQCSKPLHELHEDLTFLSIIVEIEKVEKIVTNLYHKNKNVIHIH